MKEIKNVSEINGCPDIGLKNRRKPSIKWTDEELTYIKENYGKIQTGIIAKYLNRSFASVNYQIAKLNLVRKLKKWTKYENDYIKENYKIMTHAKIGLHLGRSANSIKAKLGSKRFNKIKQWTNEEDEILKKYFTNDRKILPSILNMPMNKIATHARFLGLRADVCGENNMAYEGFGDIRGRVYSYFKMKAKKRDIYFDLSAKFLHELYNKQNKKCALSGDFIYCNSLEGHPKGNLSLDRIDSSKPYVSDNVQFVTTDVNFLKNDLTQKELINWCEIVTKFNENNTERNKTIASSTIVNKKSTLWKGCGNLSANNFIHIRKAAIRRNINFNISIEYLWTLFIEQRGYCALSGVEIKFEPSKKLESLRTASLDRIDNSRNIGYIEGNVRWTNKKMNCGKMRLSDQEFYRICENIYNNSLKV